jgi:hypothetical protein
MIERSAERPRVPALATRATCSKCARRCAGLRKVPADGVIRILLLLADRAAGSGRTPRPFAGGAHAARTFCRAGPEQREAILRKQSLIVEFARDKAMASLPALLPERADRQKALDTALYIAGARADMAPATLACLDAIIAVLGLSTPAPAPKLRSVAR